MARPPSENPRNRQLNIALTGAEHDQISARADAAGMRLIDFARTALLQQPIVRETSILMSRLDRLIHEELKRVGNNVNQIARQLNALGHFSYPELDAVLRELRVLINRIAGHGA